MGVCGSANKEHQFKGNTSSLNDFNTMPIHTSFCDQSLHVSRNKQMVTKPIMEGLDQEPKNIIQRESKTTNKFEILNQQTNIKDLKLISHEEKQSYENKEQSTLREVVFAHEPLYMLRSQKQISMSIHRVIVAMTIPKGNTSNNAYGSGVLLSKNIILTAAHNIYHKKQSMKRVQGQQGNKKYSRVYLQGNGSIYYQIEDWIYPQQFKTASQKDEAPFDYALIKLKSIPRLSFNDFLQLSLPCECILRKDPSLAVNIFGYPKDKENERKYQNYQPLDIQGETIKLVQYGRAKRNSILQIEGSKILYKVSTYLGQSGSPIIINQKIVGIHTASVQTKHNFGRLVTKDFLKNIINWCKLLKGDSISVNQTAQCQNCKEISVNTQELIDVSGIQHQQKHQEINQLNKIEKNKQNEFLKILEYTLALQFQESPKGNESLQQATIFQTVGLFHAIKRNYSQALNYFGQTLEILKGKGYLQQLVIRLNMGVVYYQEKKYTLALECFTSTLETIEQLKGKGGLESARILQFIGDCLFCLDIYTAAAEYLWSALIIYERYKRQLQARNCFILLAKCLIILNKKAKLSYIQAKYSYIFHPNEI